MAPRNTTKDTPEAPEATPEAPEAEAPEASNGKYVPRRTAEADAIPARNVGRRTADYSEWAGEIDALRSNLGKAYEYDGVPNVATVAQALRRVFGVNASSRGVNKDDETKSGTLWVQYPFTKADDGTLSEDTDKVAAIKVKYAKK